MISPWRRVRLVPVAEFEDRSDAEAAWGWLNDEEIPALVETDPGPFGGRVVTRVMVEVGAVADARRVIGAHLRP